MPGDSFTSRIRNLLRSQSSRQQRNRTESLTSKVTLEKVLGITAVGNCGLACDPRSGLVAYPAGCVVVLLNPKKNKQHHIVTPRKTITALSFSPDGKHLVTGECGHLPAVRLWDVSERKQVGELRMHDYGVSCVTFSPNGKYVVSVGNQHNMIVSVWAWKKDTVVAANKVSSKVTGVSFSEDSSYFVTVGNRHVKFWYLDQCKTSKASAPVPLLGRSALLGELRNNFFCDVACGRGSTADSTFCITASGILCEFNSKRMLEKWVDLRVGAAHSLSLSEDVIFCGCADGTVRTFSPDDLGYICSLPQPHALGAAAQSSHLLPSDKDARYPDAMAVSYDPVSCWLSCVYNDHSVYVWDVREVDAAVKVNAALFHAACIWDLEMFPGAPGEPTPAVFLSCSGDNTVRLWQADDGTSQRASLSTDLRGIIYVDGNTGALLDTDCATSVGADKQADGQTAESRTGIRSICVSPDGKHLASGDRNGMLRIHRLDSLQEILKVEAHDAEILCVEYSKPETGLQLLATASRDRLIHVLDAADDYNLVQTLDEHSSSITAVRFAANDNGVRLISCGVDKSIYFRTAHKTDAGIKFHRTHHTVRKSTLYDMGVDPSCKYAAVGCQDRSIRIFNISSGKQKKLYKGSVSEDGSLLKVQLDPSGQYVATSCSDKNISIFDFNTGECVATMFGHSEIVTGMKFTNDCKHLISVSGDSCIFVWRLAPELTLSMRERLCGLRQEPDTPPCSTSTLRREVCSAPLLGGLSSDSDREPEEADELESRALHESEPDTGTISSSESSHEEEDTGGSDEGHDWELTKAAPDSSRRPRRRWSPCMGSLDVMVKSMMDLRQLETFAPVKSPMGSPHSRDRQSTSSLQEATQLDDAASRDRPWPLTEAWLSSSPSSHSFMGTEETLLYCEDEDDPNLRDSNDTLIEQHGSTQQRRGIRGDGHESRSPDSACSLGYDSGTSSPEHVLEDSAPADSSDEEKDQPKAEVTSVDEALRTVTGPANRSSQEDFLRHNFETLAQTSSSSSSSSSSGAVEQSRVPRLSMSSRFLATGHSNRAVTPFAKLHGKDQGNLSVKPPVSKVRPLMEDGRADKAPGRVEGPCRAGVQEEDQDKTVRSLKKKKASGSHLWRLSNPSPKSPLLDRTSCLQKSHSALNLASDPPLSPAPSGDQSQRCKRPQRLFLDGDSQKPSFHFSPSSSSSSPQSPQPPYATLCWESPKLKAHHSYMNPTASSMAKSSRSSSVGEGTQTPPRSPCFHRSRRSFGEPEAEGPAPASSPLSPAPSLSSCPQSASSHSPVSPRMAATVPPARPVQNVQPSRIPLPKQPLSPRRSLCLEVAPSCRVSAPSAGAGGDGAPAPGKQALVRHLSLTLDPVFPSSIPVRQKRNSMSESFKETGQVAVATERPLVSGEAQASSSGMQTEDPSITVETCREAVTELHNSLRKTVKLYTQVLQQPGDDHQEMRIILSETLLTVKAELDAMPEPVSPCESPSGGDGGGGKALALLEQCAELLLKSMERRQDTKT